MSVLQIVSKGLTWKPLGAHVSGADWVIFHFFMVLVRSVLCPCVSMACWEESHGKHLEPTPLECTLRVIFSFLHLVILTNLRKNFIKLHTSGDASLGRNEMAPSVTAVSHLYKMIVWDV